MTTATTPTTLRATQEEAVLAHLRAGHALTPLDALFDFRSFRLAAVVFSLKRKGHPIVKRMVKVSNGARVAEYRYDFDAQFSPPADVPVDPPAPPPPYDAERGLLFADANEGSTWEDDR